MKKLSKNKNKNPIKIKFKDNRSKMKKHKIKFTTVKPPKEKVMIVAQELKFARLLAGNEKKSRDRVLKALKKWLNNCFVKGYEFKEDDFVRIWKGLFYAVWMSDKPLIQEELCDNIAAILDQFPPENHQDAMMMTGAGLKVLATEWYGLDQHRIDKFLMLVRRYLRGSLRCLHRAEWSLGACEGFSAVLGGVDGLFAPKTPSYARNAISLQLHIADCFLEEVAKVSQGEVPEPSLVELLRPFAVYMKSGVESRVAVACRRVLSQLARQSKPALEGEEKRKAWRRMGCPEGGPDALQPASDDDDDEDDHDHDDDGDGPKPFDPRAGRVDVLLPLLPPAAALVAAMLEELLRTAAGQARARLRAAADRFKKIAEDRYPFPDRDVVDVTPAQLRWDAAAAARELNRFEREAFSDPNKEALNSLSRRKRKRLLARARAGADTRRELAAAAAAAAATGNNGEWSVEDTPSSDTTLKKKKKRKTEETQAESTDTPKKLKLTIKTEKSPKTQKLDKKVKQINKENTQNNSQKSTDKSPKIVKETTKSSSKGPEKSTPVKEKVKSGEMVKLTFKVSPKPDSPKEKKVYGKPDKVKLVVKTSALKSPKSQGQSPKGQGQSPNCQGQSPKSVGQRPKGIEQSPKGQSPKLEEKKDLITPKKVKFVLKNNSMQQPIDYYKSIRESPNIPFDGSKKPTKTNLKPNSTPSPINPFFKKKLRLKIKV